MINENKLDSNAVALLWLFPNISEATLNLIHFMVRKAPRLCKRSAKCISIASSCLPWNSPSKSGITEFWSK